MLKETPISQTESYENVPGDPDAETKQPGANRDHAPTMSEFEMDESAVGESATISPLSVWLSEMNGSEIRTETLKWKVKNSLDEDILIIPILRSEGLAALSLDKEMPILTLSPEQTVNIDIPAIEQPIQSQIGAGTIQLVLTVSTLRNPERAATALSPMYYYRHSNSYKTVDVFTNDVLMRKYNGKIFEIPDSAKKNNEEVGRIADGKEISVVRADDPRLLSDEIPGRQYHIDGIGLDVGEDSEDFSDNIIRESYKITATSTKWCARWTVMWTDGDSAPQTVGARYTRAKLYDTSVSPAQLVWNGWLDRDGCAMMPTDVNHPYQFQLGTAVYRNPDGSSRYIYVQPSSSTSCEWTYKLHWMNLTTPASLPSTFSLDFSASTASSRIAAVARLPLHLWHTYQWTPYLTLITPSLSVESSKWEPLECSGTGKIYIDTEFPDPINPNNIMDHSTYRYNVAHEMGHRQTWYQNGVKCSGCSGDPVWDNQSTADPCNCKIFSSYNDNCLQNRAWTGRKQREAWANFYSAIIFSSRDGSCNWKYWRGIYEKDGAGIPVWQPVSPAPWNCATNERWMVSFCDDGNMTNKATTQDWMSFYWNVWTVGARAEIAELNDIWNRTTIDNYTFGYRWDYPGPDVSTLKKSASQKWGSADPRYSNFTDRGVDARINN